MDLNVIDDSQTKVTTQVLRAGMTGKNRVFAALRSLLVGTTLAVVPLYGVAGNVTYNPTADTTQTVAQGATSLPFTFTATSPTLPATGKPKKTPYETYGCVDADYIAKDLTYTYMDPLTQEPVTIPFDFNAWIDISPLNSCYSAPMQGPLVSTTVAVPGNADLGTYTAKLVAKGPGGIGWGEAAGVHITINVVEATATDTTPPVVTIVEPALDNGNPQDFELGNRIPVDLTAVDQESPVTSWTAELLPGSTDVSSLLGVSAIPDGIEAEGFILTAVPGGTETIQAIGQYNLQATATSAGGSSAPASRLFNVNYQINPQGPHLATATLIWDKSENNQGKCGSNEGKPMHIMFDALAVQPADTALADYSTEAFVADDSVRLQIIRNSDNTVRFDRFFGTNNTTQVAISGSTGDSGGEYFSKVNLCDEDVGTYTIRVFFNDYSGNPFLQYSKSFTLQD